MCGRYSLTTPTEAMRQVLLFDNLPNLEPRYNIAPTQSAPVVRLDQAAGGRVLSLLRWGLVPSWAKEIGIGARMINARAETVAEKPSFRAAFRARRCLVAADGFYEWQNTATGKQPWRICLADRRPFAFAGLWERWRGPDGEVETFTIITTEAGPGIRAIHPRMPVILAPTDHAAWLAPATPPGTLKPMLAPYPDDRLTSYQIDDRIGNVRNDDPGLIEPQADTASLI